MTLELETGSGDDAGARDARLTSASLLRLEYVQPPSALAPYVTTFFRMRCDEAEIRDVQPASVGLLAVFVRGTGRIRFLDGTSGSSTRLLLLTPTSAASELSVAGPWHCFGAALSPLGWAALTGLSASEHANRLYDAERLLGPAFAHVAEAISAAFDTAPGDQLAAILGEAIAASLRPLPPGHVRLMAAVADWLGASLSPKMADLAARSGYSPRQAQRLVDHYFGLPPKGLVRKYRALRAAAVLMDPQAGPAEQAAVQNHFYDQSHMIRELRLFAGRTPARIADPDAPYLSALLDPRNFREIAPRIAPMPDDLHA